MDHNIALLPSPPTKTPDKKRWSTTKLFLIRIAFLFLFLILITLEYSL